QERQGGGQRASGLSPTQIRRFLPAQKTARRPRSFHDQKSAARRMLAVARIPGDAGRSHIGWSDSMDECERVFETARNANKANRFCRRAIYGAECLAIERQVVA